MDEETTRGPPFAIGDVVGDKYRIVHVIGDGASGVVYVAERLPNAPPMSDPPPTPLAVTNLGSVALKVIHRGLVRDRQISRRFHREAAILRKLRSPHIVPLLDFGELDDGLLYMALELVEGRALDAIIREGALEPKRAVEIIKQVCEALEVAHSAGVVHRDLKPGNVLVQRDTEGREIAQVCDFGMAKVLRGDASDSLNVLTEQNMVFGTPEYMAPEQARGDEVDARCDVYAAGVMLYEMLTGRPPFQSATPIGVMTAHLVEEPKRPSTRAPGKLTPALEGAVLHALAKKRAERYPSARTFADALDAALERPYDLKSIAPPPEPRVSASELGMRDTEHALRVSGLKQGGLVHAASETQPARSDEDASRRFWITMFVIFALVGIAAGIIASLVSPS